METLRIGRRAQRICTTIGIAVLTSCFSCSRAPRAQVPVSHIQHIRLYNSSNQRRKSSVILVGKSPDNRLWTCIDPPHRTAPIDPTSASSSCHPHLSHSVFISFIPPVGPVIPGNPTYSEINALFLGFLSSHAPLNFRRLTFSTRIELSCGRTIRHMRQLGGILIFASTRSAIQGTTTLYRLIFLVVGNCGIVF